MFQQSDICGNLSKNKALWTRSQSDVSDDEYSKFYKALTDDYEKHLSLKRSRTESSVGFTVFFLFQNVLFMIFLNLKRNLTYQNLCSTCFCHEQIQWTYSRIFKFLERNCWLSWFLAKNLSRATSKESHHWNN
jgi:hypothetical protein